MSNDRYQHGLDKMMEYAPKGHPNVASHQKLVDDLKDLAPDLDDEVEQAILQARALLGADSAKK